MVTSFFFIKNYTISWIKHLIMFIKLHGYLRFVNNLLLFTFDTRSQHFLKVNWGGISAVMDADFVPKTEQEKSSDSHLLVILGVVLVTARILVLLPVLAVLAGGEQHHVLPIVHVI